MASGAMVSGLDRLVEAVEAAEAAARQREGFVCPHPGCARVFSKRYNQQAHMRLHDGTRPFSCPRCGKDFMWKSSLKSHAKMHDKMDAAAKAAAAASGSSACQSHPQALKRHASQSGRANPKNAQKGANSAVGKRRTKSASPSRKVARQMPKKGASELKGRPSSGAVSEACAKRSAMSLQLPSPVGRVVGKGKGPAGRQSPDSVSRMDLETATLLTMFR